METKIFYTKEQLAQFFGDYLTDLTKDDKQVNIALSGGSTPETIFDVISQEYRNSIRWDRLRFFWGDERCVPPDHDESNYKMARQHLFDHLPIPDENIFRIKGELPPGESRLDYLSVLDSELPRENGLPVFDIVMLGMGDDGHTASIFPGEKHLWNSSEWCETATHPSSGQKRITLTGQVINNAREIIFLVTGENKAAKVDEILNARGNYREYPASFVDRDKSTWLLDQLAMGQ